MRENDRGEMADSVAKGVHSPGRLAYRDLAKYRAGIFYCMQDSCQYLVLARIASPHYILYRKTNKYHNIDILSRPSTPTAAAPPD